jgi:hypothetical protein
MSSTMVFAAERHTTAFDAAAILIGGDVNCPNVTNEIICALESCLGSAPFPFALEFQSLSLGKGSHMLKLLLRGRGDSLA